MAKKKETEVVADDLSGTVEGLARDHFEREKAAYEERTGIKVNYELPAPVTRTPLERSIESVESVDVEESSAEGA
jgi:hypothetical protein